MHRRTSVQRTRFSWLAPLAALALFGCPNQELAPLGPCTVSAVREEIDQTGVSEVDLLFVIDNSYSMANEQQNLQRQLERLALVLTSGDRLAGLDADDPRPAGVTEENRYFTPVSSLHLGVITTELAVIETTTSVDLQGCLPALPGNPNDDARLQTSTVVAAEGQTANRRDSTQNIETGDQLIAPRSECAGIMPQLPYLEFETAGKSEQQLMEDAQRTALEFSCIATVGVLGCPFEQQLEAMWKAVAPSDGPPDFLADTAGHGDPNGVNSGFVRPNAILAVIHVTDEEDCSITEAGRVLFSTPVSSRTPPENEWAMIGANLRCGEAERQNRTDLIRPVQRYIDGLRSLKPDNPDRIIFAGLVGVPETLEPALAEGRFDEVLAAQAMQFRYQPGDLIPQPACTIQRSPTGPLESAYPARRIVQVAEGFGENSAIFSICRQNYGPAVDTIIDRIAAKLRGNCLPRRLFPDENGQVRCEVYEIIPEDDACSEAKGHVGEGEIRTVTENGRNVRRRACQVQQIRVSSDGTPEPDVEGWYYDQYSPELTEECPPGEQQRILFTTGATPAPGSGATFECFQPVASIKPSARGFEAINTFCGGDDPNVCGRLSDDEYDLLCVEQLRTCQIACEADSQCPPGWVCANYANDSSDDPEFCQLPTCQTEPVADTTPTETSE